MTTPPGQNCGCNQDLAGAVPETRPVEWRPTPAEPPDEARRLAHEIVSALAIPGHNVCGYSESRVRLVSVIVAAALSQAKQTHRHYSWCKSTVPIEVAACCQDPEAAMKAMAKERDEARAEVMRLRKLVRGAMQVLTADELQRLSNSVGAAAGSPEKP